MSETRKGDRRIDDGAESRLMAEANGWVMVRHPSCMPYTMMLKEWLLLPAATEDAEERGE